MTLDRIPWSEQKKIAAWTACRPYLDWPPTDWRIDRHDTLIRRSDHGRQTEYGWEVDHVCALALGGTDTLDNVEALHWRTNRQLGAHVGNALSAARLMTGRRGLFGRR